MAGEDWWRVSRSPASSLDPPEPISAYSEFQPLEKVAHRAQSVVLGTVVGIEGSFWNTGTGQAWNEIKASDYTVPALYREVELNIESVIFEALPVAADGETVRFVTMGDGSGENPSGGFLVEQGAHFEIGDRVILFLEYRGFPLRENLVDVWMTYFGPWAVMTEKGEDAFVRQQHPGGGQRMYENIDLSFLGSTALPLAEVRRLVDLLKAQPTMEGLAQNYPEHKTSEQLRTREGFTREVPECLDTPRGVCE